MKKSDELKVFWANLVVNFSKFEIYFYYFFSTNREKFHNFIKKSLNLTVLSDFHAMILRIWVKISQPWKCHVAIVCQKSQSLIKQMRSRLGNKKKPKFYNLILICDFKTNSATQWTQLRFRQSRPTTTWWYTQTDVENHIKLWNHWKLI